MTLLSLLLIFQLLHETIYRNSSESSFIEYAITQWPTYFFLYNFGVEFIPFKLRKWKKNIRMGKKHKTLEDANYDLERNDSWNVWSPCRFNLRDFPTNYISNCFISSRHFTYQIFSSVTLKTLAFSRKIYREPMKWRVCE